MNKTFVRIVSIVTAGIMVVSLAIAMLYSFIGM